MNPWHPLPSAVYAFVEQTPETVLLESSRPGTSTTSRLFTAPRHVLAARELADLPALFERIEDAVSRGLFAAGYFSYECGRYFEPTASLHPSRENDLLAWFGIYDRCCRFDHSSGDFLDSVHSGIFNSGPAEFNRVSDIQFGLSAQQFTDRIEQIHKWIRAGEVYQLNFTFPIRADVADRPAALYARLSSAQPVDYGTFLQCQPGRYILSLSPELFFRVDHCGTARRITTQPMKGTARRGRTTAEDRQVAEWLRNDPKNCAENVMIVDLIRNDLGRLCSYGSVTVDKLFEVEHYPTIWQMISTITGDLRPDVGYEQIFRALFPCGSITGAPKVRAMQLLAEIEDGPRGVYTGSIGYFSREQTIFNVAIRTLSLEGSVATMGVGGGIVIDSDPNAEFRECQLKAEFFTQPMEYFSLIEAIFWNGSGFQLLELHLDRLDDSAAYFGFSCDRAEIKAALLEESSCFVDVHPRKVRLLLDSGGKIHIESECLPVAGGGSQPARVCIARQRTDPADRFLFHKSTRRTLYDSAFAAATEAGFIDVIFQNSRGEVTEGAISNLFIEKSGHWYTPPLDCGVLPGVYRRYLLATRPEIEEKVLTLDELKAADSVYLSNAVRGLRRVIIDSSETETSKP